MTPPCATRLQPRGLPDRRQRPRLRASAKRKAAQEILGSGQPRRASLPDNDAIDAALLSHLQLFDDEHARRVSRRRQVALDLMDLLQDYEPMVTGAVWKGIVAEHAPIHLQSFSDHAKELAIFLVNQGIAYDPVTMPHLSGRGEAEAMAFYWRDEPVIVSTMICASSVLRHAGAARARLAERGNRQALLARWTNEQ
ncbi:MAG: UDP-N-acetylmuramate--alanine ligase [Burkholderiaceae bacterium]